MNNKEYLNALMKFGLSYLQARVYLGLVGLEKANVQTISKVSNVVRQDIYRIMPSLLKLGLVEKIVSKPTMYKATQLKLGLSILLRKKENEFIELQKKESWFLNNFNSSRLETTILEDKTSFRIISETTLLLKMHKELIQNTRKNIDSVIPFVPSTAELSEEFIYLSDSKLTEGSVDIRLITSESNKSILEKPKLTENTRLNIRYIGVSIPFGLHIFDKKEVTLSLSTSNSLPCLWSNNPNILFLAQNYFGLLWNINIKNLICLNMI